VTISQPVAARAAWCSPGVSWNDVVVRRMRGGMITFVPEMDRET
jgi:hypothetical protein